MPDLEEKVDGGLFVDKDGKILGKHRGYPFYTIGQRKGLEIALGKPTYVTQIIPETNTIVLGDEIDLESTKMRVLKPNLIKYESIEDQMEVFTKIRYKSEGTLSTLTNQNGEIHVQFFDGVKSIAPGQSAVFYEGEDVVGGGIISKI